MRRLVLVRLQAPQLLQEPSMVVITAHHRPTLKTLITVTGHTNSGNFLKLSYSNVGQLHLSIDVTAHYNIALDRAKNTRRVQRTKECSKILLSAKPARKTIASVDEYKI